MTAFLDHIARTLSEIEAEGLTKRERQITSAQGAWVTMAGSDRPVLNLCANNYLGLADHQPDLLPARARERAHEGLHLGLGGGEIVFPKIGMARPTDPHGAVRRPFGGDGSGQGHGRSGPGGGPRHMATDAAAFNGCVQAGPP